MLKVNALLMVILGACGGHKQADTTPETTGDQQVTSAGNSGGAEMIPPEKMDEVTQDLKRKNMIVSRCLATAMEDKDVPRGTHGHISFEIKISPDGHADDVKVIKSDIEAQTVIDCARKHVQEIAFPTMPKVYETSYTFAMEAN